jgi:hypothetical protein
MTHSGATASEKSPRGTVSSPHPKRQILSVGVIDTPEGTALLFEVAEYKEPHGIIDGQINLEASDKDSGRSRSAEEGFYPMRIHHDSEGDITHWTVKCVSCGLTGVVLND